jgi:hypothetical protein
MKTKLFLPFLVLVLMISSMSFTFGQTDDHVIISGTVRDARNNRPLPYATMYIPGTYMGTVANSDGFFTFKVKKNSSANHFLISYMGFEVGKFNINQFAGKESTFTLQPHVVSLQEVTFRPMNPRDLVLRALQRIPNNYPQEQYNLTGFYRETIKQRRDYLSVAEAVIDIHKESYNQRSPDDMVRIIQGRKSGAVKPADTLLIKLQGGPQVAMLIDIVKYNQIVVSEATIDYYDYELQDLVIIDDKPQYVIAFKPKVVMPYALFEGKLYICNQTLAITMADFGYDLSDKVKASAEFIRKKPASLRFEPLNTRYLVKYQQIGDQYFVSYIRSDLEFAVNWRRRIFRNKYDLMFELAVMDRSNENVTSFSRRESFRNHNILSDMVPVYFSDDFWGDYNYIQPDVNIEEAINKLNRNLKKNQNGR